MQPLAGDAGVRHAPPSAAAVRTADSDRRPGGAECMRIMHQGAAGPEPAVGEATEGAHSRLVATIRGLRLAEI
jgi:hypothetical protein